MLGRQSKVVNAIKNINGYEVRVNKEGEKLRKIKEELEGKLVEMKGSLDGMEGIDGTGKG